LGTSHSDANVTVVLTVRMAAPASFRTAAVAARRSSSAARTAL
jgi:hypothetical protein